MIPKKTFLTILMASGASLLYLVMFLTMAYPFTKFFNSFFIGGPEDGAMSYWSLWWVKYSLIDAGQSPLNTTLLFYPQDTSLVFHSIPKFLAVLGIPLQELFGLTSAYNIIITLTFVGTGLTTYWLTYHLVRQHLPAIVAGAFFMLAPYRWGQISHLTLLSTVLIPVYILLLMKGRAAIEKRERKRWLYFALAGAVLGITGYDTEYYPALLIIFSIIFFFFYLPTGKESRDSKNRRSFILCLLMALAVAAVIYLPLLVAAVSEVHERGNYAGGSAAMAGIYSTDLLSVLLPGRQSAYFGEFFDGMQRSSLSGEPAYLGWSALLLASIGVFAFRRLRVVWLWVVVVLVFMFLAFGPSPLQAYHFLPGFLESIPGPFRVLAALPLLDAIRVPSRFICMSALAVSVLAGFGTGAVMQWFKQKKQHFLPAAAFILVIFAVMYVDLKPEIILTSANVPAIYETIGSDEEQGSVIVIPLGWKTGMMSIGNEQTWTQIPQTVHKRPILGGMVARAPEEQLASNANSPILRFLASPGEHELTEKEKDSATIARFFDDYHVIYIICHKVMPDMYLNGSLVTSFEAIQPETLNKVDDYVKNYLGMKEIEETDEVIVYKR